MHKDKYEELILRFAKELHDVGVTDSMRGRVSDQYEAHPNVISVGSEEVVKKFTYQHEGYLIEASQTIKIAIKKCNL